MQPTARPWRNSNNHIYGAHKLKRGRETMDEPVAETMQCVDTPSGQADLNAAYIVHVVNSHDVLVDVLQQCVGFIENGKPKTLTDFANDMASMRHLLRAAITKAERKVQQ